MKGVPTRALALAPAPPATVLPVAVDHLVVAALTVLDDKKLTATQRDLADRIYELASSLEDTYTYGDES
jgi:hypothetical protein